MNSQPSFAEPATLLLSWQPKSAAASYVVAKIEFANDNYSFTYLTESTEFIAALQRGFSGYPAFSLKNDCTPTMF